MATAKPLTGASAEYFTGEANEALQRFALDDHKQPVTFQTELKETLNFLAVAEQAHIYVDGFLEAIPQHAFFARHTANPDYLKGFHALKMLYVATETLAHFLNVRFEIQQAIDEHDASRGAGADTSAAGLPSPTDIDEGTIRRAANEGALPEREIQQIAYGDDAVSDGEIAASASDGEVAGRYAGLTPGSAFEKAKTDLLTGLMRICLERMKPAFSDMLRVNVVRRGEITSLVATLKKFGQQLKYEEERRDGKGFDGLQDL